MAGNVTKFSNNRISRIVEFRKNIKNATSCSSTEYAINVDLLPNIKREIPCRYRVYLFYRIGIMTKNFDQERI